VYSSSAAPPTSDSRSAPTRYRTGRGAATHHRDRYLRLRPTRLHRQYRAPESGTDHGDTRPSVASSAPATRSRSVGSHARRVVTVNPVIGCGDCVACAEGNEQLCDRRGSSGWTRRCRSAFAELMIAPARNAVALPATVPEEYGALVEPLTVGYHAAVRGQVTPDDLVLVIGGGPNRTRPARSPPDGSTPTGSR